jgi:ATP-dependent RNA helicase SUPV3L1/SUV3
VGSFTCPAKICTLHDDHGALTRYSLQEVEDMCRQYSAYAWLSYRCPDYFPSGELAGQLEREASERIDAILQSQNAALRRRKDKAATYAKSL